MNLNYEFIILELCFNLDPGCFAVIGNRIALYPEHIYVGEPLRKKLTSYGISCFLTLGVPN